MTRILSDYYGRGIVRSNQESTNLRAYSRTDEVTAAEAIKTNKNVIMPAAGALKLVERMNGCTGAGCLNEAQKTRMEFDDRDKRNIRIVSKNAAYLYAFRPMQDTRFPELPYLSLYEFFRYWRIELAAYVVSDKEIGNEENACYQARLTVAGCEKVAARKYPNGKHSAFEGGKDYLINEEGGESWVPFPDIPVLARIRQTWILVRNERPKVPSFCKAPMPDRKNGNEERNARIVMTYFHPFTLQEDVKNPDVPHVSCLRREEESWEKSLMAWLDGNVLTHEARNAIQNFFFVAQMRPDFIPDANKNDEDIFSDEDIDRETIDIQRLLHTHCGTARDDNEDEGMEEKVTYEESRDAMRRASRMCATHEQNGRRTEGVKRNRRHFKEI